MFTGRQRRFIITAGYANIIAGPPGKVKEAVVRSGVHDFGVRNLGAADAAHAADAAQAELAHSEIWLTVPEMGMAPGAPAAPMTERP